MLHNELLDEILIESYKPTIPPRLLAWAWVGWSSWLLFWSWNAYAMSTENALIGSTVIFAPYNFLDAYHFLVQGIFALVVGCLFFKKSTATLHFVLGYLIAGSVFHLIDAINLNTEVV